MKVKFVSKPIPYESHILPNLYVKGGDGVIRLPEGYDLESLYFPLTHLQDRVSEKFNMEISRYAFKKSEREHKLNYIKFCLKTAKKKGDEQDIEYENNSLNENSKFWDNFFKERDPNKYLPDIFHYDVKTRILTIEYNESEDFFINGYKFDESFTTTEEFYIKLNKFKLSDLSRGFGFEWDTRIFIDDSGKDYTKTNLYKEETGGCFGIIMLIPILSMLYYLFL